MVDTLKYQNDEYHSFDEILNNKTPCWVEKGQVKYYTYIAQSASPSKKAKKKERIWGSTAHSLPNDPISLWCFGGLPNFVSIQVRCENIQRGVRWWWYMQSCIGALKNS